MLISVRSEAARRAGCQSVSLLRAGRVVGMLQACQQNTDGATVMTGHMTNCTHIFYRSHLYANHIFLCSYKHFIQQNIYWHCPNDLVRWTEFKVIAALSPFCPGSFRLIKGITAEPGCDWLHSLKNDWNPSNQWVCAQQVCLVWIRAFEFFYHSVYMFHFRSEVKQMICRKSFWLWARGNKKGGNGKLPETWF